MTTVCSRRPVLFLLGKLEIGGSETKFANLAVRMNKAGLPVHVAYLEPPEDLKERLTGVPLIHLGRKGKWSWRAFRALSRYVKKECIATVVTVNPYPLSYAVPLTMVPGSPGPRVIASINTSEFQTRREQKFMALYSALLRRCAGIVFGSQSQQQDWLQQYKLPASRTRVIYNGVDGEIFDPAGVDRSADEIRQSLDIPNDAFVVVCVSQFRPEKAHANLLRAIRDLRNQQDVALHVILVGDGPQQESINALLQQWDLEKVVHLVGAVSDVRPYLKASNLFVLTSTAVETFSNAALEASAMGLPVVISDVGGAREMFPSTEYASIYPRNDVGSLASAIARFVDAGPLSDADAKRIRRDILARFSVDSMDRAWQDAIWQGATLSHPATASKSCG